MWTKLQRVISPHVIAEVLEETRDIASSLEDRHFVKSGKTFFDKRTPLLRKLHIDVEKTLNLRSRMTEPAINHAFLLFKSGPGPATMMHQDRPYWLKIEPKCTMFTVWIALAPIGAAKGALMLDPANEVDLDTFFGNFGERALLPHHDDQYGGGGFTTTMDKEIADMIFARLAVQDVEAGDVIVFDAFEPHCSTANETSDTRLSMKIVYGERASMASYAIETAKLEKGRGVTPRLFSSLFSKH